MGDSDFTGVDALGVAGGVSVTVAVGAAGGALAGVAAADFEGGNVGFQGFGNSRLASADPTSLQWGLPPERWQKNQGAGIPAVLQRLSAYKPVIGIWTSPSGVTLFGPMIVAEIGAAVPSAVMLLPNTSTDTV